MRSVISASLISILSLGWIGCVDPADEELIDSEVTVPPRGGADTFDVGEWNLEWFGATTNGPTNEALQLANVHDVIAGADLDLWALEEVVSTTQFNSLKSQLPGYDGFLANDPIVASGSTYYSSSEQKVGILYKSSAITVRSAQLILTANDYDFAGRPPLEVTATATVNGATIDLVFIIMHAKAMADSTSYQRRVRAATALKAYLDGQQPTARLIVTGDYNDDLDASIYSNLSSPYSNFVADTPRYTFPSKAFTDATTKTTVNGSQPIDHTMLSNEMAPLYVANSAEVFRVDAYVPSYGTTTSDHYPTLTRYKLGTTPPPPPAKVFINEILANEPGSTTAAEFVELVNTGGQTADLGGWTLSDSLGIRHVFANGTSLSPGKVLVVYGGATAIPGGFLAVAASSGSLSLTNSGDSVTLRDTAGNQVDGFTYSSALASLDGVSMNRSPDADPTGTFVLHTSVSTGASSPGSRANGTPF
jgi:endonuclease/exonuclease/phosphatase family metal-dependent hydrolase